MMNAVIIDDEHIVLQGMKQLIDWDRLGIQIAGTAMDGESGYQLLTGTQPDIVFVDIRIPGMTGLELIEKSHAHLPDSVFIIFSGFTDFEYAKKAIALGVLDYIEKPVTVAGIEEVLRKAVQTVQRRKKTREMTEKAAEVHHDTINAALLNWIDKEDVTDEARVQIEEQYELKLGRLAYVRVLAATADLTPDLTKWIQHLCTDLMRVIHLQYGGLQIFILTGEEGILLEEELKSSLAGLFVSVGYGTTYREARQALRHAVFMECKEVIRFEQLATSKTIPTKVQDVQESLLLFLRTGEYSAAVLQLSNYLDECRTYGLSTDALIQVVIELLYAATKASRETGRDFTRDGAEFVPHLEAEACRTYTELCNWALRTFGEIGEWIQAWKGNHFHKPILRVKEYIDQNYHLDVTMQGLAEMAMMSPAYFSTVFKDEVGVSYIKYLTTIRMEAAAALLKKGYKVTEISERIGYPNYRYFCEIFKKHFGVTPQQFKGARATSKKD